MSRPTAPARPRPASRQAELGPQATAHDLIEQNHPALETIGHYLGVAIGSLVNIFGLERMAIGGGFGVAAFEQLLPAARSAVLREVLGAGGRASADRACSARSVSRNDRRRADGGRGALQCPSPSARRRSGISTTSPCACSPSFALRTSCSPRTRATPAACSSGTGSRPAALLPRAQRGSEDRRARAAPRGRRARRARDRCRDAGRVRSRAGGWCVPPSRRGWS